MRGLTWFLVSMAGLAAACGSTSREDATSNCDDAKLAVLEGATGALELSVAEIRGELAAACAAIADGLGVPSGIDPSDPSALDDAAVRAACDLAEDAVGTQAPPIAVTVGGGTCAPAHAAQLECERDVSGGGCDTTLEDRCPPSALTGQCPGVCSGPCTSSPGAAVACEGACAGRCEGTCDGACGADGAGACEGACAGTCSGTCEGVCETLASDASCAGGWCAACSENFTELRCEAALSAPACTLELADGALCEAVGAIHGHCDRPVVLVEAASAEAVLAAELPRILWVQARAERLADGAMSLLTAHGALAAGCEADEAVANRISAALASMQRLIGAVQPLE